MSIRKFGVFTGLLLVCVIGVMAGSPTATVRPVEVEERCIVDIESPGRAQRSAVGFGPRTLLAVIVDFADATVAGSYGVSDPIDFVAGVLYDNSQNAAGAIADSSFGLVTVEGDADGDGQYDIVQVTLPDTIVGADCSYSAWSSAAALLVEQAGVDLALYQHRMYMLPKVSGGCSGWAGRGQLGCGTYCNTWIRTTRATTYAHEIGHNLGLHHASTDPDNDGTIDSEYGDLSCLMGSSSIWRQYNGPHKVQMDWVPDENIVDVVGPGPQTLTVEAMETDPGSAVHPQVLRIHRPDNPGRPYLLTYRTPVGYDATMNSNYLFQAQLHAAGSNPGYTYHIESLNDLEWWGDPVAHDLVITQLSHDANTVSVRIDRTEPDADADGYGDGTDCDENDPAVNPGAVEVCDYIDNNCDSQVDEGFVACDIDQDGYDTTVDCNDDNPAINPGAVEICDYIDNNCDGATDEGFTACDIDGDGYDTTVDCNDNYALAYPGAPELCDYIDNNCDGFTDEPDWDGDGAGNCLDVCPEDPTKGWYPGQWFWCECGVSEAQDEDGDTIPDCADNCPGDPVNETVDSDGDGIDDCFDQCPADPTKTYPLYFGQCPCGVADEDGDGDGILDCFDQCPGADDTDSDIDGVADCVDLCPADPWKSDPGACGCGLVDLDSDLDGACDGGDNCAWVPNPSQADPDEDGTGHACDCSPDDPESAVGIGPASNLRFVGRDDLEWEMPVETGGASMIFDLLRSGAASDFSAADCVETGTSGTTATDPAPPAPIQYYLIRARGECGDHLGLATPEQRRIAGTCPAPGPFME